MEIYGGTHSILTALLSHHLTAHRATDRLMMQVKRIWALGNYDTENTFVVCVDQKGY